MVLLVKSLLFISYLTRQQKSQNAEVVRKNAFKSSFSPASYYYPDHHCYVQAVTCCLRNFASISIGFFL